MLSLFFFRITKSQKITISLIAFLFFPGVFIHELSHFLTALFLLVPVGEVEFVPKLHGETVKLGSVAVGKTDPFRRALIGVSPVLVGLLIIIGSLSYFSISTHLFTNIIFWQSGLLLYILFEIGNTMFSSKKDLEGTLELVVTGIAIFAICFVIGIRLPEGFLRFFSSENAVSFMKNVDLFLLIPVTIDAVVCGSIQLLIKR